MSSVGDESMAKLQCLMPPPGTSRQPPEEPTTSEEPFSPVLEHYLIKTFDWKVSGYRQMVYPPKKGVETEKTYCRRSPSFRFMGRTWYLHLYPNLPSMVVCLMLSGEVPGPPARLHHSFGLRDVEGEVDWKIQAIGNFGAGTQNVWKKGKSFLSKEELISKPFQLVQDDAITIVCELSSDECKRFLRDCTCPTKVFETIEQEQIDKGRLDVLFLLRGRVRAVNSRAFRPKCQLKSPLFASCLVPGTCHPLDCDVIVFSMLVLYLDIGKVCRMSSEKMLELYELAGTYEVVGLRERCLACVIAWLEPEVVITVMDFAKKHSLPELLEVATKYLVSHAQQVVATSQWVALVREDPERANQLYRRIAERVAAAVSP